MKKKLEKCLYCDEKMEAKTTRQRFCSDKCRVYWNRENPLVKVSDLTAPTPVLKPKEQPKSNFTINTKPRNLDELKTLCPFPERSDERSEWVRTERQKYGI